MRSSKMTESFLVGPEDLGKEVFARDINRIGVITSYTSEHVTIYSSSARGLSKHKLSVVNYLQSSIRF